MLIAALILGGCDRDQPRAEAALLARRKAVERPELWSVRAVGQAGRPVEICASQDMRTGFIRPAPALGGQSCTRLGQAVRTAHGWAFRCMLGPDTYAVSSAATGDTTRSFETRISITPLQGRGQGQGYQQTLSYVRLGACPTGWAVGQATNQHGGRVGDAVTSTDGTPSP